MTTTDEGRITAITVLYGGSDKIGNCLASVQAAASIADLDLETILVDNRPGDGTAEAAINVAPDANLISNPENVGFGRACNQGFAVARSRWLLLLNPDATLEPSSLRRLMVVMNSSDRVGAVAPTLRSPGRNRSTNGGMLPGLRSAAGHFWLLNRMLVGDKGGPWRGFLLHQRPSLGPRRVEWLSGGAVLLRAEAVQAVGGFDPAYFLYAEDVDLGRRLGDQGWESWIVPDALGSHSVAASSGGTTDRWYIALHDYYRQRARRTELFLFDLIAGTGLALRAATSRDAGHKRQMLVAARAAFRFAAHPTYRGRH